MSVPLVSAILTCAASNRLNLARKAVNNFIKQLYTPFELLIVNGTGQSILTNARLTTQADRLAGTYIREISVGPGLNAAAMKNVGLNAATGDWVVCLDDDDYCHPHRILYQMAHRQEGRPCLLQYQLRVDLSKVLKAALNAEPLQPDLHLLKKTSGISCTALFPRLNSLGDPWLFNEALNIGEYDDLIAYMTSKGCVPVVCNNSDTSLLCGVGLPLLSVAMYHGLNELQPHQFFEVSEADKNIDGINSQDIEFLKLILSLYDFNIVS
jgi:glycosyltransferase involved in cell wall biosynthesis